MTAKLQAAVSRKAPQQPGWFDSELDWYANERAGDMGVRAMPLELGVGSPPTTHDGISDDQVKAATRARKIEHALAVLPRDVRLLLEAVHLRLSPRAHKDVHASQQRCIEVSEAEIAVAVAVFRREMRRC